jgi:hypothetical protein
MWDGLAGPSQEGDQGERFERVAGAIFLTVRTVA